MNMYVRGLVILILLLELQGVCMASSTVEADAVALVTALRSGSVESIQIVHISYETKVRTHVDSALLLKTAEARCEVISSAEQAVALATAIEQSSIRGLHESPDLRWGLLIISKGSKHSLFLDGRYITGTGRRGVLNGSPIAVNSALVKWVERAFRTACPSLPL